MNRTAPRWLRRLLPPAMSAGVLGALLVVGCRPKSPPPQPEAPQLPTSVNFNARSSDVVARVTEFQVLASQLQLLNPSQHPPVLRQVFVSLSDILPKLAGPQPGGVFVHQFSVVMHVRDQINARGGRIDSGLLDSGLIATYNAMRDLGQTEFYRDDALTQKLDELAKRVSAVQGSPNELEHQLNVRDAVAAASDVLLKLSSTLKDKVATTAEIPPASGPSSAPAMPGPATPGPATPGPAAPGPATTPTMPPDTAPGTPTPPAAPAPATPPAPPAAPEAPAPPTPPVPPAAPEGTPPATPPSAPTTPDATPPVTPGTPPQAPPSAPATPEQPAVPAPPAPPAPSTPAPPEAPKAPETPPAPPPSGEGNK